MCEVKPRMSGLGGYRPDIAGWIPCFISPRKPPPEGRPTKGPLGPPRQNARAISSFMISLVPP